MAKTGRVLHGVATLLLTALLVLAAWQHCVDAAVWENLRKCADLPFCVAHRALAASAGGGGGGASAGTAGAGDALLAPQKYSVVAKSPRLARNRRAVELLIADENASASASEAARSASSRRPQLRLVVAARTECIVSVTVEEAGSPLRSPPRRFQPADDVLVLDTPALELRPERHHRVLRAAGDGDGAFATVQLGSAGSDDATILRLPSPDGAHRGSTHVRIAHAPLRVELYTGCSDADRRRCVSSSSSSSWVMPAAVVNARDLLHMADASNASSSVGLDVVFPRATALYGLPERTLDFALPDTPPESSEPLRMYNLDVFEFELEKTLGLYGSIPFVMAHRGGGGGGGGNDHHHHHRDDAQDGTVGALWMPASETYVDIESSGGGGSDSGAGKHVHFYSESGTPELFLFAGPSPKAVSAQLAQLTGAPPMPPSFSLGYHQCRWNYRDDADVRAVDAKFDEHDIPYDVLWLDIEHTDGKKYFTWDTAKFPEPDRLQRDLASRGERKMVTIIDPHIKSDPSYALHKDASAGGWYVKSADGKRDYDGWCWPGKSHYMDFADERVRRAWASRFTPEHNPYMTEHLHAWVDMNEPSVFNGPEVTMPKELRHVGGKWQHRDLHNIFGQYVQRATFDGLRLARGGRERPFVLSRSFFTGSQRWGAVWTGDNAASWEHLRSSVPMLLSLGVAGLSFVGADVGGFFGDPSPELLVRWYQAGAFQPFFRAHAHLDTKRREPWLFGEPYTELIRRAIAERYAYLPYWYALFAVGNGVPPMRPLVFEFPRDGAVAREQSAWMVGDALLVAPVMEPDAARRSVYLPTEHTDADAAAMTTLWYDVYARDDGAPGDEAHRRLAPPTIRGGQTVVIERPPLARMIVYQRGGTIVARRERQRRSTAAMRRDPYTLHVALDAGGRARGFIYADDGKSYQFEHDKYVLMEVTAELVSPSAAAAATAGWNDDGGDDDGGNGGGRAETRDEERASDRHVVLRGRRIGTGSARPDDFAGADAQIERIVVWGHGVIKLPRVGIERDWHLRHRG